jgi:hypothetical protein
MSGPRSIPARSKENEAKAKLNDWTLMYEYFRQLRGRTQILPRRGGNLRYLEMN